jgi:hypothetical protein
VVWSGRNGSNRQDAAQSAEGRIQLGYLKVADAVLGIDATVWWLGLMDKHDAHDEGRLKLGRGADDLAAGLGPRKMAWKALVELGHDGGDDISDPRQQRVPDIAPSASADRGHRGSANIRCTFLESWARPQRRHALRGVPKRSSSHGKELEEDSLERRSRSPHNLLLFLG